MTTVKATYLGNLRTECEHLQSGTRIITDAPVDNHGKGESFSPTDLCATSLATCMMTIMGLYAQNTGLDLTGTEIEITKVMAADPRRIGEIGLVFRMPPAEFSDKHRKALERAAQTCPVHYTLSEEVRVLTEFVWQI